MGSLRYLQGKHKLRFPEKYVGDPNHVVYRSSWELAAFLFIENTPQIVRWAAEKTIVPYRMPEAIGGDISLGRVRRYFVDLSLAVQLPDGSIKKFLVEIKPHGQTIPPTKRGRMSDKTYQHQVFTWIQNDAKWKAAREFCAQNNMTFLIWTEYDIFPNEFKHKVKKPRKKKTASKP